MVEKGIRSEICHSIFRYAKFSKKYPKENQNKTIKNRSFLMYQIKMIYIDRKPHKIDLNGM